MNRALWLPCVLVAACGEPPPPAAPATLKVQAPKLRPFLAELQARSAAWAPPNDATQRELRELGDIALQLMPADQRTAARAERSLLEHKDAWFVLEPALLHEQVAVRRRAAWLCGRSNQTALQLPLLLRLKYELDAENLVWIADALLRLGNDTGLAWLDAAIGAEATAQRAGQLAVEALRARGATLADEPTWADVQTALRERTAKWLATGVPSLPDAPPPEPVQLAARLATHLATTQGTQLRPVDDARYVLRRAGRLGLPMLSEALTATEHYLRTMALQVLAELGPTANSTVDAVLPLLGDPFTAPYAVRTLGEIGGEKALPQLRSALDTSDSELRAAAAQALGLLGDRTGVPALQARLRDGNETTDVRVSAAFGLRCFGDDAEAEAYLAEREAKQDYHQPMLVRLRERLAARAK